MQLEEHAVEDVIVLAPSGRMARNESFGAVRLRLHHLAQEGRRKLVLNLAGVSYMDSTCIGELFSGLVTIRGMITRSSEPRWRHLITDGQRQRRSPFLTVD